MVKNEQPAHAPEGVHSSVARDGFLPTPSDYLLSAESRLSWEEKVRYYFSANKLLIWILCGRRPVLRFTGIVVLWYLATFIVCSVEGSLIIPGKAHGLLNDWLMFINLPALIVTVYTLRRLVFRVEELLMQLQTMIKPEHLDTPQKRQKLAEFMRIIRSKISLRDHTARKWYWVLIFMWIVIYLLYQVLQTPFDARAGTSWAYSPRQYPWSYSIASLWTFFYLVVVLGNASWYLIAVGVFVFRVIKKYADENALWIVPNAPDGEGGLSPIGSVAFGMTFLLWPSLVLIIVSLQQNDYNLSMVIGTGVYLLFSCVVFFWPLLSTHYAMTRAKRVELFRVSFLFRHEYAELPSEVESANRKTKAADVQMMPRLERMSKLSELHADVNAMPVWPFDFATVRKFIMLLATPLISAAVHNLWPSEWTAVLVSAIEVMAR